MSMDGSSQTRVFNININDVDEFDIGLVADVDLAANTVAENASNGTTVGVTADTSDPDGNEQHYHLFVG